MPSGIAYHAAPPLTCYYASFAVVLLSATQKLPVAAGFIYYIINTIIS